MGKKKTNKLSIQHYAFLLYSPSDYFLTLQRFFDLHYLYHFRTNPNVQLVLCKQKQSLSLILFLLSYYFLPSSSSFLYTSFFPRHDDIYIFFATMSSLINHIIHKLLETLAGSLGFLGFYVLLSYQQQQ